MSGLIGSILATTNALKANQTAVQTAGKNMANVNNANYSRQRVEFGISGGISESIITQQRDAIINSKIVSETSVTGSLDAQSNIYRQLQLILGEQIIGNVDSPDTLEGSAAGDRNMQGISTAISDFFNSMHALSTDPDSVPAKSVVIAHAEQLVKQFHSLSSDLDKLDQDVQRAIGADVTKVNGLLNEIAELNSQVAKIEIQTPGAAHEYRDLRQQKLTELANYIDFETTEVDNGQVLLIARDKDANEVLLVDRARVSNRLRFNEPSNELFFSSHTVQPLGPSPNATTFAIEGGRLQGHLYTRSTTDPFGGPSSIGVGPMARMREDLDTLAREVATQVSTIYDDPGNDIFFFDDDANADAIDLSNVTAANIQLYAGDGGAIPPLNSNTLRATATTNSGANEIALAIGELSTFTSTTLRGNTFTGFVSEMATDIGFELSNTTKLLENQALVMSQLQDQRAAVSGVSIDEELANIIRFQRSFEASARVLQVMDELLELVTNGLVR